MEPPKRIDFVDLKAQQQKILPGLMERRGHALRLPKPLPRYLKEDELTTLFGAIKRPRDRASSC